MSIQPTLPHQWLDLATLEARVGSAYVLANQLQEVAEELFYKTSLKAKAVAQQIFDAVQHAKHALAERDYRVVAHLERLQGQIEALWLTKDEMDPEAIAEELVDLVQKFEAVEEPASGRARTLYKETDAELEALHFHYLFPVVDELGPKGLFAEEMTRMTNSVRETDQIQPLNELTATQRAEVLAQVGNPQGLSAEGLAHAMEGYLTALRTHAGVAQSFYAGRLEEGLKGLLDLPDATREQIDQLVWEATKGEGLDPLLPESQMLIANAVLQAMEQRMGFNDEL